MFTNFLYEPSRDGYDLDAWKSVYGTPIVTGGSLYLQQAAMIHRGDSSRGQITMNVNVPSSPAGGESRRFGFYGPSSGAYAWFSIEGEALNAAISDGRDNLTSTAITWDDTNWSANDVDFTIRWEAGLVRFIINDSIVATLSGYSVPHDPLAIYLSNGSDDGMKVRYIHAEGLRAFYMHTDHADTDAGAGPLYVAQVVSIAEDVTDEVQLGDLGPSNTVSITEDVSVSVT